MGIVLILLGSGVYTWAKSQEAASLRAASAADPPSPPPPAYSSVAGSPEKSVAILIDDAKRRVD